MRLEEPETSEVMAGGTSDFLACALPHHNSHQTDLATKWSIWTHSASMNCPCPIEYQLNTSYLHPRRNCGGKWPCFAHGPLLCTTEVCCFAIASTNVSIICPEHVLANMCQPPINAQGALAPMVLPRGSCCMVGASIEEGW